MPLFMHARWLRICVVLQISLLILAASRDMAAGSEAKTVSSARKLNNLVSVLLEVPAISKPDQTFAFVRPDDGWIFVSATGKGKGSLSITLDGQPLAHQI